jgi:hypothetical protein
MRVKTASPAKVSRPAAKQRPAGDKGVISLKGAGGIPRKGKRPARGGVKQSPDTQTVVTALETPADPPSPATPSASDVKTMRLERIKERAGAKRPVAPSSPVAAPVARPQRKRRPTSEETPSAAPMPAMEVPAVVMEAPAVIEAPAVVMEAPAVIEVAPVIEAPAVAAPVDTSPGVVADVQPVAPAVTSLAAPVDRGLSATAHRRAWSPPEARRRTSSPVTVAVRLISKLLRWGRVLRR